jgi:alanine-synthesizing transaminase
MRFARRTDWDRSEGRFARAVAEARRRGYPLTDLTESNPTRAALFDAAVLIERLGHPRGVAYAPDALGHPAACEAVVAYYAERDLRVDPARTLLTASTSEAYGYLFKLLCERGDRVLVPAPSYPLFDFLAASEDITLTPYSLVREHGWRLDLDAIEGAIDDRTRAVLLVHPNNPTGSLARRDEAAALERICAERGLALIVDEVFGDYPLAPLPEDRLPSFAGRDAALTFVLSGLSKVLALPQLKLAWTVVSGPEPLAREATARLEVIADTYLSVGTPVQLALPELLSVRREVQAAVRERTTANLAALDEALAALGPGAVVRRLPVDAGWYAILEVPRIHGDDTWIELLLERAAAVVHPGYFFDLDRDGFLVVSLLPEAHLFRDAAFRVLRAVTDECDGPTPSRQITPPPSLPERARDLAERAHRDQRRKGDATIPYFVHLEATANILRGFGVHDEHVLAAAYLHDLLEDQPQFADEMITSMPPQVVAIVRAVTEDKLDAEGNKRPKEDRFQDYIAALREGSDTARKATLVSFADQLHNARSLVESEAAGHSLLGRLNTAPDQKLHHLAELRAIYEPVLLPEMLAAFDEAVEALAATVEAWRSRG